MPRIKARLVGVELYFDKLDLDGAIEQIGTDKFVHIERGWDQGAAWAVLHDPEEHNVLHLPRRDA